MHKISINFLVNELRYSQSDICLIKSLEALDERFSPQIFCQEIAKPPVLTQLPIYPMYHAQNLRNDGPKAIWFANNWRCLAALRNLAKYNVCCNKYFYVDCPSYLYVHERRYFLNILEAYRNEFEIITSCKKYHDDLVNLGCNVLSDTIDNYNHEQLSQFVLSKVN